MVPQEPPLLNPCFWGLLGCKLEAFWEQEQQSTAAHVRKEQDLFTKWFDWEMHYIIEKKEKTLSKAHTFI